jgi:2-oxoglutarate ferredoxin oxidoreductase subunit alpha
MAHKFISGAEAAVLGAIEGGAEIMFGYPITPSTEILQGWIATAQKKPKMQYLQTEDETSAGFALLGAVLAGKKAFTATAGPGNVLMQDPLSMAENLRLPFVGLIMQRGGPSTGTVNYSQQEVTLSAFGGNGDGLRIVYSASDIEELYHLTAKAFSVAWKYRFPTLVLGDGHLAKTKAPADIIPQLKPVKSSPILKEAVEPTFLRNCFSSEESFFNDRLKKNIDDWFLAKPQIVESESYKLTGAKNLIIAHGSVGNAAKDSVDILRSKNYKIGLFRPITLNPIDDKKLKNAVLRATKIFIVESSLNQLSRIVKYALHGVKTPIIEISKPAVSFSSEEIASLILKKLI